MKRKLSIAVGLTLFFIPLLAMMGCSSENYHEIYMWQRLQTEDRFTQEIAETKASYKAMLDFLVETKAETHEIEQLKEFRGNELLAIRRRQGILRQQDYTRYHRQKLQEEARRRDVGRKVGR